MDTFTPADHRFMARALTLARRGLYTAHPNPRVGCVLVNDGRIVGEGWHRKTGEAHAEINALDEAGKRARGTTAYVTLEPCSHHGKTPPCVEALIAAGVAEVVTAMVDPNSKVSGSGHKALEDAGIAVRYGLMQAAASRINAGFVSRMQKGRPLLRLKIAASLDGRTAMANGESQWITGEAARNDVQLLRAQAGAVMVGIGTVIADDPALDVRRGDIHNDGMQPMRVVLDSKLRMPPSSRMLRLPGTTTVFCSDDAARDKLQTSGAGIEKVAAGERGVDLGAVMRRLAELEINEVLAEAGPTLAGSLLDSGLVDELVIYQAPHIMGSETRPMFVTPRLKRIADKLSLRLTDVRKVGEDLKITAVPSR
ncbi:MAG: bifunctional diaminohydroxyphosphoribosylaminopyrimidine deaminase/5-amino-6-(5-phosphoribosylamino)uracil reductase RibD [Woeseiaceae bacterium]|nr:bifunctional diaminohydroxyphosphoribosylaminopyrimidine deaminase/5-amino-6-(5-phosphoribosylamino)uracil reductase RibD [Woeseiaceae bacterium]